jgi:hypothetical protein
VKHRRKILINQLPVILEPNIRKKCNNFFGTESKFFIICLKEKILRSSFLPFLDDLRYAWATIVALCSQGLRMFKPAFLGKKKPSDDDSLAGFEETNEAEIAPIDGPDIQGKNKIWKKFAKFLIKCSGLSVKPEDMSRIKSEIEENRKKLDSSSNKRTNKIVVRRVTSSSTESKSKKIILARKSDSDYNVEEVQKGMKFQESGEIVG